MIHGILAVKFRFIIGKEDRLEKRIGMSVTEFINAFLAICGGISIVGGAIAVIWKVANPAVKLGKRVEVLEGKSAKDYEAINDIKDAQSILCQGMLALIDSRLSGNNEENLKKSKDSMIKYLAETK